MTVTIENQKAFLWLRAALAAGLYTVAAIMLILSLTAVGVEMTPTTDPDTAAGAWFCLILSTVFLAATAAASWTWKTARALCLLHLGITVYVWTQVPAPV
ncbi:hypothetical protein AB0J57_33145 [Streptomyces sp. NPDC049837]|uniref:hypothetical protein n=1 Tax=Streptomyces sp. NPDC049837 TaxID=3155277 RepID=UPI00342B9C96